MKNDVATPCWKMVTSISYVTGLTEGKLDIKAIKMKVKKAKTKKLGAPPASTPPLSSRSTNKKSKTKSKD